MNPNTSRWLAAAWRVPMILLIVTTGLASIVGSGGGLGLFGDAICDTYPDSCRPPQPVPQASIAPTAVTAQVGTPVSFTAQTVNTGGTLAYQWRRSTDGGTTYPVIVGATSRTFTIPSVNLADDAAILMADVALGNGTVLHATARLAVSPGPPVSFTDGEFAPSDWRTFAYITVGSPTYTHVETRRESGGNPGAFREMSVQFTPDRSLARVLSMSNSAVYDPQTQGAVLAIDYTEDCLATGPADSVGVEAGLVLEQAGRRYVLRASRTLCLPGGWVAVSQPSLRAQDLEQFAGPSCGSGETCPDFSTAGTSIRFGHDRVVFGMPGASISHGIDNWHVNVWRR